MVKMNSQVHVERGRGLPRCNRAPPAGGLVIQGDYSRPLAVRGNKDNNILLNL